MIDSARAKRSKSKWLGLCCALLAGAIMCPSAAAQENPLSDVHTAAPPPPTAPKDTRPAIVGGDNVARRGPSEPGASLHVNVNMVLVPMTVTDPMNRLVTGLERENFYITDNHVPQTIKTFATQDAPLTIGIVFVLSGSMGSKFLRARRNLEPMLPL